MPSPTDVAWAAGFFDGEGTIAIAERTLRGGRRHDQGEPRFRSYQLLLRLPQTSTPALDRLVGLFGGRYHSAKISPLGRRPIWEWYVLAGKAANALTLMLPFLTVKHEEALLALQFRAWQTTRPAIRDSRGRLSPLTEAEVDIARAYRRNLMKYHRPVETEDQSGPTG